MKSCNIKYSFVIALTTCVKHKVHCLTVNNEINKNQYQENLERPTKKIKVSDMLLNEFEDNSRIISCSFPTLFPIGATRFSEAPAP